MNPSVPGSPASLHIHDGVLRGLVVLVARGDRVAFAALHEALSADVYAQALCETGDADQSEEVTSGVFVEMWHLAVFHERGEPSVRAWARDVAHRRASEVFARPFQQTITLSSYPDHLRDELATLLAEGRAVASGLGPGYGRVDGADVTK